MDLRKLKAKKGFTLIELMVVIVIIGILVAIALPNFISAQDRAKLSSVKANMHTVQTVVETYAVDWGGVYGKAFGDEATAASGVAGEAKAKEYWKSFKNPFSGIAGVGQSYMAADPGTVDVATGGSTAHVAGAVSYNAVDTDSTSVESYTKYYIYGGEKKAAFVLLDKGAAFYLSNQ